MFENCWWRGQCYVYTGAYLLLKFFEIQIQVSIIIIIVTIIIYTIDSGESRQMQINLEYLCALLHSKFKFINAENTL